MTLYIFLYGLNSGLDELSWLIRIYFKLLRKWNYAVWCSARTYHKLYVEWIKLLNTERKYLKCMALIHLRIQSSIVLDTIIIYVSILQPFPFSIHNLMPFQLYWEHRRTTRHLVFAYFASFTILQISRWPLLMQQGKSINNVCYY